MLRLSNENSWCVLVARTRSASCTCAWCQKYESIVIESIVIESIIIGTARRHVNAGLFQS